MKPSERIEKLLHLAVNALGETGHLYKDVIGLDREKTLKTLGRTLISIHEIRQSIYALHPELTSDQWKLINESEEEFQIESKRMATAEQAEENKEFEIAKSLYQEIASTSKIRDYRIFAQSGLYRISTGARKQDMQQLPA